MGSATWALPTADTVQLGLSRSLPLEGGMWRAKDGSWVTSTVSSLRGPHQVEQRTITGLGGMTP